MPAVYGISSRQEGLGSCPGSPFLQSARVLSSERFTASSRTLSFLTFWCKVSVSPFYSTGSLCFTASVGTTDLQTLFDDSRLSEPVLSRFSNFRVFELFRVFGVRFPFRRFTPPEACVSQPLSEQRTFGPSSTTPGRLNPLV